MNEVFTSYKREDETRVGRLVRALEGAGFSVWWDRGLIGGENWRAQIESALDAARCVIVVWTRESVGPSGDFVRDEAAQAKQRGVLVPVLLDMVSPPLGFGEVQAIDLTRWKGNPHDPFFVDLCAVVRAKLEGCPLPPSKGPTKRLVRRLTLSSLASSIGFGGLALAFNLFSAQDQMCEVPLLQPHVSDVCGTLGIGHRPTKEERLAWAGREPGSCDALRKHIKRFPNGAYRQEAAELLAARRVTKTEFWKPGVRQLDLFVPQGDAPVSSIRAAKEEAIGRAEARADQLCKGFAATTLFRFRSAKPVPMTWNCGPLSGGISCGFEGHADCDVEEMTIQETESCGKSTELP